MVLGSNSCANDTKAWLRRGERDGTIRAVNAWEVFEAVMHMPQPSGRGSGALMHYRSRYQYYVCREDQETPAIRAMRTAGHIVNVGLERGWRTDCKAIPGIRSGVYQFRATRAHMTPRPGQRVEYRVVTCWCRMCASGNYAGCLTQSRWISHEFYTDAQVAQNAQSVRSRSVSQSPIDDDIDLIDDNDADAQGIIDDIANVSTTSFFSSHTN